MNYLHSASRIAHSFHGFALYRRYAVPCQKASLDHLRSTRWRCIAGRLVPRCNRQHFRHHRACISRHSSTQVATQKVRHACGKWRYSHSHRRSRWRRRRRLLRRPSQLRKRKTEKSFSSVFPFSWGLSNLKQPRAKNNLAELFWVYHLVSIRISLIN